MTGVKELDRDVRLGLARAGLGLVPSLDSVGDLLALFPRVIGTETLPATALGVVVGVTGALVTATFLGADSPPADFKAAK